MSYQNLSLHKLSNEELLSQTKELAFQERSLHTQVIRHLEEIDSRKLYLKMGFSSLFDYATKELAYSEGAAYRRIQAMKLCRQVPETENQLQTGRLSLSTASQLQTFFEKQAQREKKDRLSPSEDHIKKTAPTFPLENSSSSVPKAPPTLGLSLMEKKELIRTVEGQSTRQTTKLLSEKDPHHLLPKEQIRFLGQGQVEIRMVVDEGCQKKWEELKSLLSHRNPSFSHGELLSFLVAEALQKYDPCRQRVRGFSEKDARSQALAKKSRPSEKNLGVFKKGRRALAEEATTSAQNQIAPVMSASPPKSELSMKVSSSLAKESTIAQNKADSARVLSRYIPSRIKKYIWQRDGGQCTYMNHQSQRRCSSRHLLQIDHIHPFAFGGKSVPENLRLLCASHNRARMIWEGQGVRERGG